MIKGNHLRLVVKSGPEREDLKAKLNGVAIGRRFRVNLKRHRRYLEASLVDDLRHGENKLVVWVKRRRGDYRRAAVNFVVAHRMPMVSAGRDIRVAAGAHTELQGQISMRPVATASTPAEGGGPEVQWILVSAPPQSELTVPLATIEPATPETAELAGFEEAQTLSPVFAPDVAGRYKVQMTVSSGAGKSTDTAEIYAVPPTPMVALDTEVQVGEGDRAQPAIRVSS
jgi:hypothetical protein